MWLETKPFKVYSALYITLLGTVNYMCTLFPEALHSVTQIVANCMGSKLYYGL